MRAYGQKRVYGRGLTRTSRPASAGKVYVETGVKSRKAGRRWDVTEYAEAGASDPGPGRDDCRS